jgi:hypothetical protein
VTDDAPLGRRELIRLLEEALAVARRRRRVRLAVAVLALIIVAMLLAIVTGAVPG